MIDTEQFPWWEKKQAGGFFEQLVVPARPLLILAIFIGAYMFLFEKPQDAPEQPAGSAAFSGFTNDPFTEGSNAELEGQDIPMAVPTASLLASLFGEDAVGPLFTIPEISVVGPSPSADAGYGEPMDEPQRSIYRYLVDASDIGFTANASKLGLALATAEQGETNALDVFISRLEERLLAYAALVPPTELQEAHSASLSVLERYIAHLRTSRDKTLGGVEETWNSPERSTIAEEAGRVTQQIRDIVHNYDVVLPPGVLP